MDTSIKSDKITNKQHYSFNYNSNNNCISMSHNTSTIDLNLCQKSNVDIQNYTFNNLVKKNKLLSL